MAKKIRLFRSTGLTCEKLLKSAAHGFPIDKSKNYKNLKNVLQYVYIPLVVVKENLS
jgi:hypothetical protein